MDSPSNDSQNDISDINQQGFNWPAFKMPPSQIHTSREEALDTVNTWARGQGFALTIERSKAKGKKPRVIYLSCDRREPPIKAAPMKGKGEGSNRGSRGTGCRFSIICVRKDNNWEFKRRAPNQGRDYCVHNHPQSSGTGDEHPILRYHEREANGGAIRQAIIKQYNTGAKTRHIQEFLEVEHPIGLTTTAQDIRNVVTSVRQERRAGRNTTQTLVEEMEGKADWITRTTFHNEDSGRLQAMFFAYKPLLAYAQIYCKVYVIDITYNTNSSDMPLFECIAVDACRRSVCVCFEFLPGEDEDDCIQSLKHLREILGEDIGNSSGVFLTDKADAIRNAVKRGLHLKLLFEYYLPANFI